jgi:hypothetical protein
MRFKLSMMGAVRGVNGADGSRQPVEFDGR